MSSFEGVQRIDEKLKQLTGTKNSLQLLDFLITTQKQNALLVTEDRGEASVAVCLTGELVERLKDQLYPRDFSIDSLSDLSVAVEELSHFNYYCDRAMRNLELTGFELELQAEVDKFIFALDCLHQRNEEDLRDRLFEVMFGSLKLGDWVSPEEEERYQRAHEVARSFCRKLLDQNPDAGGAIRHAQSFYQSSLEEKIRH